MRTAAAPVLLFISLLFLAAPAFAQSQPAGADASQYFVQAFGGMDRIVSFIGQNMTPQEAAQKVVLVRGSSLGAAEDAALEQMKQAYPMLGQVAQADDSQTLASLEERYAIILLVGGPGQNAVSREAETSRQLAFENLTEAGSPLIVRQARLDGGRSVTIFSLARGYENEGRSNVQNSPLAAIIPEKYVPAAATATGMGLMWLLPHILKLVRMFVGKFAAAKGKQDKKMRTEGIGFDIGHTHINLYELVSIFAAAAVFGVGIAWTFAAGQDYLLQIVGANVVVACVLFYGQSALRILIAHMVKMKTQFQFWLGGSALTLLSAYLGNMLASPGFFVEEEVAGGKDKRSEEQKEKDRTRKAAWIRLGIIALTAAFGLGFFVLNLLAPSKLLQAFMVACTLNAACDMLPIKPMAGTVIKKWNWLAYGVLALGVWGLYLAANFL